MYDGPKFVHQDKILKLRDILFNMVKGQYHIEDAFVACLLIKANIYLEGIPGIGKTQIVRCLEKALGVEKKIIFCNPSMVSLENHLYRLNIPELIKQGRKEVIWEIKGNELIFFNELNRASQAVQDELLRLLQEREIIAYGEKKVCKDIIVIADGNPYRGPLDKALADRFIKLTLDVPRAFDELEVLKERFDGKDIVDVSELITEEIISYEELKEAQEDVTKVTIPEHCKLLITLVSRSLQCCYDERICSTISSDFYGGRRKVCKYEEGLCSRVDEPVGLRLAINIARLSKALAWMYSRKEVSEEDVRKAAEVLLTQHVRDYKLVRDYIVKHMDDWREAIAIVEKIMAKIEEGVEGAEVVPLVEALAEIADRDLSVRHIYNDILAELEKIFSKEFLEGLAIGTK
ncbi:MAG: AAA family ATPase [Candidatus Baldrarchaeia archaeon]